MRNSPRIIIIGPPLAGKGTQSKILSEKFHIPHISSGDILRHYAHNNFPESQTVKKTMDQGALVPSSLMTSIIKKYIHSIPEKDGFILDGYPRTVDQMKSIDFRYNLIVCIDADLDLLLRRARGRLVHRRSGRVYNTTTRPPKVEGKDDVTGEELEVREDDREDVVRRRYEAYKRETEPLVQEVRRRGGAIVVDGGEKTEEVTRKIKETLRIL